MRKIPLGRSLIYFLEEIEFSDAGLAADPDAASLAPAFQQAISEWDGIFKSERLARRNIVRSDALVAVANERFDATTMQFAALARASSSELLNRCFSLAPGQFIRRNLRKQCESTQNVIIPEIAKLDADHPCKPFGTRLASLAEQSLNALENRAQAIGNRQSSANDVLEWKEGINALRTTTYAELLKISVAKGYPKSWVESFFRQAEDDSEADTTPESPTDPANP
ncbi:MAG TPA: hypothetical protein PK156_33380 [Polyangium sp.]|nr:hypothetical protein [Polyangium sp.]